MADDVSKTAQQIWSMLDNMAAEDPAAYRKFIDKQLKDGKEAAKPPTPHMCIQTAIRSQSSDCPFFINIMEWSIVPSPKTCEDPIPTFGGPIYDGTDDNGDRYKCVSVAFNPSILKEYGQDSSLLEEQHLMIGLAIKYIENQHKLAISRNYTIFPKSTSCKGSSAVAVQSLVHKMNGGKEPFASELEMLEKTLGPMAAGCKDSLLNQLNDKLNLNQSEGIVEMRMPNEVGAASSNGAQLIEELSSSSTVLQKPDFELNVLEQSSTQPRHMLLTIKLPGVSSARECSLDISEDDICLLVPEKYELTLNLPERTSVAEAVARFAKRTSELVLTLPTIK